MIRASRLTSLWLYLPLELLEEFPEEEKIPMAFSVAGPAIPSTVRPFFF